MTTETKTPCFDSAPGSVKQAVTAVNLANMAIDQAKWRTH